MFYTILVSAAKFQQPARTVCWCGGLPPLARVLFTARRRRHGRPFRYYKRARRFDRAGRSSVGRAAILRSRSRSSRSAPRGSFLDCSVPRFVSNFSLHSMTTGRCLRPNGPYVVSLNGWAGYIFMYNFSHQLSDRTTDFPERISYRNRGERNT